MTYGQCEAYGKQPISLRLVTAIQRLNRKGFKEYTTLLDPHEWREIRIKED